MKLTKEIINECKETVLEMHKYGRFGDFKGMDLEKFAEGFLDGYLKGTMDFLKEFVMTEIKKEIDSRKESDK